jgi:lipoprotein-releasing system ATP-binding protein
LLGPSGSGKSTLLQAVGLLEGGFEGSIRIKPARKPRRLIPRTGVPLSAATALGFVYQFHHLLPDFNAIENVVLPQIIHGADPRRCRCARKGAADGARPRRIG